jgi:serine/threonine protein phosphatase PrpC
MTVSVEVTAFTHRGRVRDANEDSITVAGWVADVEMTGLRRSRHTLAEPLLCAVADGMGGHAAGEVASRYTIKRLAGESFAGADPAAVAGTLHAVNRELYATMLAKPAYRGMGTTVVGLLLTEPRLVWFNVGDSRLYRWRDGALQQVSIDDTPAGARSGALIQCLGGSVMFYDIEPHVGAEDLPVPSRWLLCSDGLTDMVTDPEIAETLALDDEAAGGRLFELAMAAGGHDNFSIVLASVAARARD